MLFAVPIAIETENISKQKRLELLELEVTMKNTSPH